MKNFEPHKARQKDQVTQEVQVPKEYKFQGSVQMVPGLPLWEFNMKTLEIRKAEYKSENLTYHGGVKRELVVDPDCAYIQALNYKNALRKFKKHYSHLFENAKKYEKK